MRLFVSHMSMHAREVNKSSHVTYLSPSITTLYRGGLAPADVARDDIILELLILLLLKFDVCVLILSVVPISMRMQ